MTLSNFKKIFTFCYFLIMSCCVVAITIDTGSVPFIIIGLATPCYIFTRLIFIEDIYDKFWDNRNISSSFDVLSHQKDLHSLHFGVKIFNNNCEIVDRDLPGEYRIAHGSFLAENRRYPTDVELHSLTASWPRTTTDLALTSLINREWSNRNRLFEPTEIIHDNIETDGWPRTAIDIIYDEAGRPIATYRSEDQDVDMLTSRTNRSGDTAIINFIDSEPLTRNLGADVTRMMNENKKQVLKEKSDKILI